MTFSKNNLQILILLSVNKNKVSVNYTSVLHTQSVIDSSSTSLNN